MIEYYMLVIVYGRRNPKKCPNSDDGNLVKRARTRPFQLPRKMHRSILGTFRVPSSNIAQHLYLFPAKYVFRPLMIRLRGLENRQNDRCYCTQVLYYRAFPVIKFFLRIIETIIQQKIKAETEYYISITRINKINNQYAKSIRTKKSVKNLVFLLNSIPAIL